MALLQGFEHDIFISYAFKDNVGRPENTKGWVTQFVDCLKTELQDFLADALREEGRELSIYFDKWNIEVARDKDGQLEQNVKASAIMVVFVSGYYLASPNCRNELDWFLEAKAAGRTLQGLGESDKLGPIAVVALSGKEKSRWPEALRAPIYTRCYHSGSEKPFVRLCHSAKDTDEDWPKFLDKVGEVAKSLANKLELGLEAAPAAAATEELKGKSLLVLGTEDLSEHVDALSHRLSKQGGLVTCPSFSDYGAIPETARNLVGDQDAVVLMLGEYAVSDHTAALRAAFDTATSLDKKVFSWTESVDDLDRLFQKKRCAEYCKLLEASKVREAASTFGNLESAIVNHFAVPASDDEVGTDDMPIFLRVLIDADERDDDIAQEIKQRLKELEHKTLSDTHHIKLDFTRPSYDAGAAQKNGSTGDQNELDKICDGIAVVNGNIDPLSLNAKVTQFRKAMARRRRHGDSKIRISVHNAPPPKQFEFEWSEVRTFDLNSDDYMDRVVDFILELADKQRSEVKPRAAS